MSTEKLNKVASDELLDAYNSPADDWPLTQQCQYTAVEVAQREAHGLPAGDLWARLRTLASLMQEAGFLLDESERAQAIPDGVSHKTCGECAYEAMLCETITDDMVAESDLITARAEHEEALMGIPVDDRPLLWRVGPYRARTLTDWVNPYGE